MTGSLEDCELSLELALELCIIFVVEVDLIVVAVEFGLFLMLDVLGVGFKRLERAECSHDDVVREVLILNYFLFLAVL